MGLWLEVVAGSHRRWGEEEELGSSTHLKTLLSSAGLQEPEDHRGNCLLSFALVSPGEDILGRRLLG